MKGNINWKGKDVVRMLRLNFNPFILVFTLAVNEKKVNVVFMVKDKMFNIGRIR